LYPGGNTEQKVKQMNFLLPYIRRIPETLAREQFAADAAQRLGIGSAALREELRIAALKRRERVETNKVNPADRPSMAPNHMSQFAGPDREKNRLLSLRMSAALQEGITRGAPEGQVGTNRSALTNVERVLLRVLANTEIESAYARHLASEAVKKEPSWFEHLAAFPALMALAGREARDPMEVVEEAAQKALLAEALLGETRPPNDREVESALQEVEERAIEGRLRDLRAQIAEAERRGDHAGLALLTQRKLELDRALRHLHSRKPSNP
jgi:DNA primase